MLWFGISDWLYNFVNQVIAKIENVGGYSGDARNDQIVEGIYNHVNLVSLISHTDIKSSYLGGFVGIANATDDIGYKNIINIVDKIESNADYTGGFWGRTYEDFYVKNIYNKINSIISSINNTYGFVSAKNDYEYIENIYSDIGTIQGKNIIYGFGNVYRVKSVYSNVGIISGDSEVYGFSGDLFDAENYSIYVGNSECKTYLTCNEDAEYSEECDNYDLCRWVTADEPIFTESEFLSDIMLDADKSIVNKGIEWLNSFNKL